ncbi:cytochrome P450 [Lentinula aciculospora]|uniref:Cytochrome P450 n=1 Tax=Lentinula aciculospora TaxID=153920 RepID=A0A9W8ZYR9_9AGAR|nr:cytochrome P450 [Lentinula aciculospora]
MLRLLRVSVYLWMFNTLWLAIGVLAILRVFRMLHLRTKLPPGPLGLPIIGNLLQISISRPWLVFDKWAKQYGPIFYLNIAGQNVVVLGTQEAAADLLDRRAAIYSDRPDLIVLNMLSGGMLWAFVQPDALWKRQRRAAYEALSPHTAKEYFIYQETESVIMLSQLLADPENFMNHFERASTSLMLSIVYGWPSIQSDHPIIPHIDQFNREIFAAAAPASFLVDLKCFSWMKYLPRWMCAWRRNAENAFNRDSVMLEMLFAGAQKQMDTGDETASVAGNLLRGTQMKSAFEAARNSATLFAAGADTTSDQLSWFIQAIVLYPEAQRLAQEELDRIVGPYRLPTFDDYGHLPYIRACVKEVMRWRGVGPMGLPHRLREDDYYKGYFLPKDTVCYVNVWSLHHDKQVYGDDAEHFNPGRYLDANGNLVSSVADTKDVGHFTYGFGKRICVGRHVANNTLFIQIAFILWAFNITPELDENGKPNLPDSSQFDRFHSVATSLRAAQTFRR